MAIPVKLQAFEGPLDLLLHLIDKNKIDIYDIPIAEITDQYMAYVREMDTDDMNVTSEFLVMAATLLDIKSRMLLPRTEEEEEEEEDPREELVRRLLEYKMFKYLAGELKDRNIVAGRSMYREQSLPREVEEYTPPLDYEELLGSATLEKLRSVFRESLKRSRDRKDPVRSGFGKIRREQISITDKKLYVEAWLQEHPHADFAQLLERQDSKEEIIVTFLVVLELIREARIKVHQDEIFGRIFIDTVPAEERAAGPAAASGTAEEPDDIPEETEVLPEGTEEAEEQRPDPPQETVAEEKPRRADRKDRKTSAGPALLAASADRPEPEKVLETEVWKETKQYPSWNRSCSSWVKRWRSPALQRRSSFPRRRSGAPRRPWRRSMRDQRADWL